MRQPAADDGRSLEQPIRFSLSSPGTGSLHRLQDRSGTTHPGSSLALSRGRYCLLGKNKSCTYLYLYIYIYIYLERERERKRERQRRRQTLFHFVLIVAQAATGAAVPPWKPRGGGGPGASRDFSVDRGCACAREISRALPGSEQHKYINNA